MADPSFTRKRGYAIWTSDLFIAPSSAFSPLLPRTCLKVLRIARFEVSSSHGRNTLPSSLICLSYRVEFWHSPDGDDLLVCSVEALFLLLLPIISLHEKLYVAIRTWRALSHLISPPFPYLHLQESFAFPHRGCCLFWWWLSPSNGWEDVGDVIHHQQSNTYTRFNETC